MSVHFDPRSSAIRTTGVDVIQRPIPFGLPSARSTIQCRLEANESEGGFCSLISRVISQICDAIRRLFSSATSEAPTTTTTCTLESRIAKGREFIDSQFNQLAGRNFARCAVVMGIEYNDGSAVPCCIVSTSAEREAFKADCYRQLEELLGQERFRNCDNGRLGVRIEVFTKNSDSTFNNMSANDSLQFPYVGGSDSGSGIAESISRTRVIRILEPMIRSSISMESRQEIVAVIRNL